MGSDSASVPVGVLAGVGDSVMMGACSTAGGGTETVTTDYDPVIGAPTTVTGASTYVSAVSYLPRGPIGSRTLGTGGAAVVRSYGYHDRTLAPTDLTATVGAVTVQADHVAYDRDGNIIAVREETNANQKQCFTYSSIGRLDKAWTAGYPAARPGSVYAEFDVPTPSLRPASKPEWGVIPGPNVTTRIYGPPPPEMPPATCIVLVCSK